jgi:hypothetical protein
MAHTPKHKTKKDKLEKTAEELQKGKARSAGQGQGKGKSKEGQPLPKSKSKSPAKMKTNQDGGSYTAKKPGAAAKELKTNQEGAAKMGYQQKFGATRMSPSKRGDKMASELMHGAGKYYDGAGMYMNGAPKYEGAGKHEPGHEIKLKNVNVDSDISDMRKVIDAQKNRAKRRDQEVGKMLQKDSLSMVISGPGGAHRAKEIYGEEYMPGDRVSEHTSTGMHYPSRVGYEGKAEFHKRKNKFRSQFDKENIFPTSVGQIDPRDKPKYD